MLRPALIGFSDFFDEVGAVKPPAPKPAVKAPPGKGAKNVTPYPKPALTSGVKGHKKALKTGHNAILKAGKAIGRAQLLLSQKPATKLPAAAAAKPTTVTTSPAVNVAKIAAKTVHLGATVAAKMSPKAMRAVQIHNDAVAKAKKATQVLAQHALRTKKSVQNLAKKMVSQKKTMKQLRAPKRIGTQVGALLADPVMGPQVAEMLGEYYESVGAAPDPANPGYLDDGTPDPAYGTTPMTDPSAAATASALATDPSLTDPSLAMDDAVDGGADLPPPPPMDAIIPDMKTVGGIPYDGSKGTPNGYVGSFNLFTKATDDYHTIGTSTIDGTSHYGYVWGSFDREGVPRGIPWGGQGKENAWNHFHGREEGAGTSGWHNVVDPTEAFASATKASTNKVTYGPLVGNPDMKDFSAMRVDQAGNMFWLPQEAPDWLLFPIKQAAAMTAQAAAKAAADAAAADAAAAAKTAADNAAAQAAQDAANALAESQAASQAKIDQGVAETQAQQALVTQQQADTAAQTVETEQAKQAGDILIQQAQQQQAQDKQVADMLVEQAKQEQAYYAAHPELDPSAAMDTGAADDSGGDDSGGGVDDDSGGDLTDDDAAAFNEGNEDVDIDYSADNW